MAVRTQSSTRPPGEQVGEATPEAVPSLPEASSAGSAGAPPASASEASSRAVDAALVPPRGPPVSPLPAEGREPASRAQGRAAPPLAAPDVAAPDVAALTRLLSQAQAARGRARREGAGRLHAALAQVPPPGEARRARADFLLRALGSRALAGLTDREGRSSRAAAAGALLELGYPYALEIAPEDLAHLREAERSGRAPRAARTALLLVGGAAGLAGLGVDTGSDLSWVLIQAFLGLMSVGAYSGQGLDEGRVRQGRAFALLAVGASLVGALFDPALLVSLLGPAAVGLLLDGQPRRPPPT